MAVRSSMSTKEESKEPDYNEDEDRDQFEEEQEEDSSKNLVGSNSVVSECRFCRYSTIQR